MMPSPARPRAPRRADESTTASPETGKPSMVPPNGWGGSPFPLTDVHLIVAWPVPGESGSSVPEVTNTTVSAMAPRTRATTTAPMTSR